MLVLASFPLSAATDPVLDWSGDYGKFIVYFLHLGRTSSTKKSNHGDCELLISPDGKVMMVDCGAPVQGRYVVETLEALGIENVSVVDPHDMKAVRGALKVATKDQADELSVIVFKAPCVLLHRQRKPHYFVNGDCRSCGVCATLGCPAISKDAETGIACIDAAMCIGCGQCAQYCAFSAIEQVPASSEKGGVR